MRLKASVILVLTALMLCAALTSGFAAAAETASTASAGVTPEIQAKMASLQVPFVPNEGQVENGQVKFYAKTFAGTVFVTNDGITYALPGGEDGNWVIKEVFAGGKALAPAPVSAPGAPVNYYFGSMEKHLSSYQEITLGEVYDKINVNLRAYGNNVEKIFTVGPGGDPADIALKVAGSDKLSVNDKGELELSTGLGTVKLTCPAAYQVIGGNRADVDVTYAVKGDTYGFTVGNYDHAYPLIIDPLLASTYLGGNATDRIYAMALDATGDVYVAGYSNSPYFPPVTGGYSSSNAGSYDVFVAKLSGDLSQLLAATYLGGAASDSAVAIALDGTNNVYITGYTKSSGFPTTLTPYQGGGSDPDFFVAKLDGSHLGRSAATCFGGSGSDSSNAIALDSGGNVFVGGYTQSSGLSMTGYQKLIAGSCDGLVVKYDSNLQFLASTYLCDVGVGGINAMAVNQSDKVYVSGSTGNNYTTTANALKTVNTKISFTDGFVSKLSNNLNSLEASTYLGGTTSTTYMQAMIFDAEENVIVTGKTTENDFPGAEGDLVGGEDAFVTKLDPDLSGTLVGGVKKPLASTLFGGDGSDTPSAIALDTGGNIYITGKTTSSTLPGTTGAIQTGLNGAGAGDVFVTKLDGNLTAPVSTYLGGTGSNDTSYALAVNRAGNVYVAGSTNSSNFPIKPDTAHVAQGTSGGGTDAFVAKLTGDLALNSAPDTTAPIWPAGKLDSTNVTDTGLILTWSGAMDNIGVTGYQLKVYQDAGMTNLLTTTTVAGATYDVTGLEAGTQYTFKVEAFDAKPNLSADGPSKTVTTAGTYADHTRPAWPSGSVLTATNIADNSLTLTWTPATDNIGVSGYKVFKDEVEYATVSSATYTTVSGAVYYTCDVTGLALNSTYTFKVEAFDAAGNLSADGPGVTATTVLTSDTLAPYWPNGTVLTKVQISASGYRLTWNAAADNVGVTAYRIYIYQQDSVATPVIITVSGVDTLYYDVTGLVGEVYYAFTIEAGDAAGNWSRGGTTSFEPIGEGGLYLKDAYLCTISNNVSSTGISVIDAAGIPLRPAIKLFFPNNVINDSVWPNNSQCVVMQTASGANVPVNVFRIPDTVSFGERNNFFVTPVNDLTPNTQYKITIKTGLAAKNGRDFLVTDRIINFTTEAAASGTMAWPSGGTMTASNPTPSGVTLAWTPAAAGTGVTSYVIIRNNSDIIASVDGTATSCDITGLTSGATYTFQVQAFNSATSWSSPGPSATATTMEDTGTPAWPSGTLTATNTSSSGVTLTWSAATDDAAVTGYQIYQDGASIATVSGSTLTYNVTGLNPGTTYTFKVEAGDDAGNWTTDGPSVPATTPADTAAPAWPSGSTLTAYNLLDTALSLTWSAATDDVAVTGYQIFKDGTLYTTVSGATTTCNVTGLTAGTTYNFQAQAGDAAGHWSTDGPATTAATAASGLSANYTVTPADNTAYTTGTTIDGIDTMTANSGGLINFTVNISPVTGHSGDEKAVFVHLRNNLQAGISSTVADFDTVSAAQAAFNVQTGDVVRVVIVDDLTTAVDINPNVLE